MTNDIKKRFIQQITTHQNIIHKICHFYCYNTNDKRDLYQEIMLQLWKSFPSFQGRSALATWIYRVALNTAISQKVKKQDFVDIESQQLLILNDQAEKLEQEEELRILYTAISKLNKLEKAVILLWLDDNSYEEIAKIMGLSVKNISVKLVRIRKKLSEIIRDIEKHEWQFKQI